MRLNIPEEVQKLSLFTEEGFDINTKKGFRWCYWRKIYNVVATEIKPVFEGEYIYGTFKNKVVIDGRHWGIGKAEEFQKQGALYLR